MQRPSAAGAAPEQWPKAERLEEDPEDQWVLDSCTSRGCTGEGGSTDEDGDSEPEGAPLLSWCRGRDSGPEAAPLLSWCQGRDSKPEAAPLLSWCRGRFGVQDTARTSLELVAKVPSRGTSSARAGLSREEGPVLKPRQVTFQTDVYDAVLVAAFGGVLMELDPNSSGIVGPVSVLMLCVLPFLLQFTITLFMCLDIELQTNIFNDYPSDGLKVTAELLLVVTVQLMNFNEILATLRNLAFLWNPNTWHVLGSLWLTDDSLRGTDCCSHAGTAPRRAMSSMPRCSQAGGCFATLCPSIALLMKLTIQYWVSTLSTSIILASGNVKEAVFNCMAMGFVAKLGGVIWKFLGESFGLRFESQDKSLVVYRPKTVCGARRTENTAACFILFIFYVRHFTVVLYALDTNILPVARDVCSHWRWLHGQSNHLLGAIFGTMMRTVCFCLVAIIRNPLPDYDRKADPLHGGICTEEYQPFTWAATFRVARRHPSSLMSFMGLLFCLLVLPAALRKTFIWTHVRPHVIRAAQLGGLMSPLKLQPSGAGAGAGAGEEPPSEAALLAELKARLEALEKRDPVAGCSQPPAVAAGLPVSPPPPATDMSGSPHAHESRWKWPAQV